MIPISLADCPTDFTAEWCFLMPFCSIFVFKEKPFDCHQQVKGLFLSAFLIGLGISIQRNGIEYIHVFLKTSAVDEPATDARTVIIAFDVSCRDTAHHIACSTFILDGEDKL